MELLVPFYKGQKSKFVGLSTLLAVEIARGGLMIDSAIDFSTLSHRLDALSFEEGCVCMRAVQQSDLGSYPQALQRQLGFPSHLENLLASLGGGQPCFIHRRLLQPPSWVGKHSPARYSHGFSSRPQFAVQFVLPSYMDRIVSPSKVVFRF